MLVVFKTQSNCFNIHPQVNRAFQWQTETIMFVILQVLLDKAMKAAVFVRPIFQVVKCQSDSVQNYRQSIQISSFINSTIQLRTKLTLRIDAKGKFLVTCFDSVQTKNTCLFIACVSWLSKTACCQLFYIIPGWKRWAYCFVLHKSTADPEH